LAKRLLAGEGVPYNLKLATEMMKSASESGDVESLFNLANVYYTGASGPIIDENEILTSQSGNPQEIASKCNGTFTVTKDVPLAISMFLQAASKDHAPSLFWIGHSYLAGIIEDESGSERVLLKRDPSNGLTMIQRAVQLQHPVATYYLSLLYLHGYPGVLEKNIQQAQELFLHSIELGHREALYALADMYYHGSNEFELPQMGKDIERAFQIYKKAAKKGHADSLYCLATMYYNGQGTDVNMKRAYDLYTMASTAGNWRALGAMATMAMDGQGIPKDEKYAMHLLNVYKQFEEQERLQAARSEH
jgi:TPR repeat protein